MSKQIVIKSIGTKTPKGNCTISVNVTNGFATSSKPYYILSNPAAVKAHDLKPGMDITEQVAGFKTTQSTSIDQTTGETITFNWLEPNA